MYFRLIMLILSYRSCISVFGIDLRYPDPRSRQIGNSIRNESHGNTSLSGKRQFIPKGRVTRIEHYVREDLPR